MQTDLPLLAGPEPKHSVIEISVVVQDFKDLHHSRGGAACFCLEGVIATLCVSLCGVLLDVFGTQSHDIDTPHFAWILREVSGFHPGGGGAGSAADGPFCQSFFRRLFLRAAGEAEPKGI